MRHSLSKARAIVGLPGRVHEATSPGRLVSLSCLPHLLTACFAGTSGAAVALAPVTAPTHGHLGLAACTQEEAMIGLHDTRGWTPLSEPGTMPLRTADWYEDPGEPPKLIARVFVVLGRGTFYMLSRRPPRPAPVARPSLRSVRTPGAGLGGPSDAGAGARGRRSG